MQQIPLTRGQVALVDDEDYDQLNRHKWHCMPSPCGFYAARRIDTKVVTMHRFIMQTASGHFVDHADGDTLNNQRANLRPATPAQNAANQRKPRRDKLSTSQFKGVYWNKLNKRWVAQVRINGKGIYIGSFQDETAAAKAYDMAARRYFGEFARPNFADDI